MNLTYLVRKCLVESLLSEECRLLSAMHGVPVRYQTERKLFVCENLVNCVDDIYEARTPDVQISYPDFRSGDKNTNQIDEVWYTDFGEKCIKISLLI